MITKKYEGLFGKPTKKKEKKKGKFEDLNGRTQIDEQFNWFAIIDKLIKELNKSDNEVYEMNYISSLNWLSYFKQRDEVEYNKMKNK